MLNVGRLRIVLPAGFEGRAGAIGRLVGDELAGRLPAGVGDLRVERLEVPPATIAAGASDREIAGAVADAIAARLAPGTGGGVP